MTIYVVRGSTGEYSSLEEWLVCAYADEEHARVHATRASEYADRIHRKRKEKGRQYARATPGENPYDPAMEMEYTGTEYTYESVLLIDSIASFEAAEAAAEALQHERME